MNAPKALARATIDSDDMGPKMRALLPQEQLFVRAFVNDPVEKGAQQRAAKAAGYSATSGPNLGRAANKLMNRPRVVAAILEESQLALRSLAPLALRGLKDLALNAKDPAVRLKALRTIIERTDQLVHAASVDLRVTDERLDRDELTVRLLRELKGAGASREVLLHFFGYSGLSFWEQKLAEADGVKPARDVVDAAYVEIEENAE